MNPGINKERISLPEGHAVHGDLTDADIERLTEAIAEALTANNATIVAHYYTDPLIQTLAEKTGGCVADSLEMARFGRDTEADTLVVAGVKFMGETAKILSPDKRVLLPDLAAACSLDLSCPIDEFSAFCDQHPDRTVVVYANTSAEVKARADWVVTSAVGLEIVRALHQQGEKILWGPDQHLGRYIEKETGADMVIWAGSCIVHDEFKADELIKYKARYPNASVLVHPESPMDVIAEADAVGSTSQLIRAAKASPATEFIVATDRGIFHKMQEAVPGKTLHIAPTASHDVSCRSCGACPWMAMNHLEKILHVLETGENQIEVPESIRKKAKIGIDRMLNFRS